MINVKLDYCSNEQWDAIDWAEFRKFWPLAVEKEKPSNVYGIMGPCRLSYEEANNLSALGIEIKVVPLPGTMAVKLQDDPVKYWEFGTRIDGADLLAGSAVQIAVPDMALMYIDEVQILTDYCTDQLQEALNDGWRILAVCPPNSQRRPDYVIGRRKRQDPFDG